MKICSLYYHHDWNRATTNAYFLFAFVKIADSTEFTGNEGAIIKVPGQTQNRDVAITWSASYTGGVRARY